MENSATIRQVVKENYAKVALENAHSGCGCAPAGCCTPDQEQRDHDNISVAMGYTTEEVGNVPEGANLGLGCGNPQAIASIKPGETVLDLGSGAGFDAFLAARQTGETGQVIGVDMTPEMISKARKNARAGSFDHVTFKLGHIENIPIRDNFVDVVISNCVINLSPEKQQVFNEAFRVLKPGGRLAVSDIVATADLPDHIMESLTLYSACVSGASTIGALEQMMSNAGFKEIQIEPKEESVKFIREWSPENHVEDYIVSASIQALKY